MEKGKIVFHLCVYIAINLMFYYVWNDSDGDIGSIASTALTTGIGYLLGLIITGQVKIQR